MDAVVPEVPSATTSNRPEPNRPAFGEASFLPPVDFAVHLANGEIIDADYVGARTVADVHHIVASSLGVQPNQVQLLVGGLPLDIGTFLEQIPSDEPVIAALRDYPIRVFCRVRPMSRREISSGATEVTRAIGATAVEVDGARTFGVDGVFAPGSQEEIFDECRSLVRSIVDGCSGMICPYGQTGAGKTFTMFGAESDTLDGVIPRACREIFQAIEEKPSHHCVVTCSFVEIICEEIVDLLVDPRLPRFAATRVKVKSSKDGMRLENLTEDVCANADAMMELIRRGLMFRTVRATAMSAASSRSHAVVIVKVLSTCCATGEQEFGQLLLCDLAGSERLGVRFYMSSEALKESVAINRSLASLREVLLAFASGKKLIPYRNSRLTHMMMGLGKQAKIILLVAVSPAATNSDETSCSLRWATMPRCIVMSKASPRMGSAPTDSSTGIFNFTDSLLKSERIATQMHCRTNQLDKAGYT